MEMLTLYYPPYSADDDDEMVECAIVGLKSYVADLGHATAEEMAYAWKMVRRSHKTQRWPLPAAFLEFLPEPPTAIPPKSMRQNTGTSSGGGGWKDTTLEERDALVSAGWPPMSRRKIHDPLVDKAVREYRDRQDEMKRNRVDRHALKDALVAAGMGERSFHYATHQKTFEVTQRPSEPIYDDMEF